MSEPTELEKLQQEYNNTAFQLGNSVYQRELLERGETEFKAKMETLSRSAAEIMKKNAPAAEGEEKAKNDEVAAAV